MNKVYRFDFTQPYIKGQNSGTFYKLVPEENFERSKQEYTRAAEVLGLKIHIASPN